MKTERFVGQDVKTAKFDGQDEGWRALWLAIAGVDGHYADMECVDAELERYLILSCNE